ncbi:MAG: hypothetical protein ABIC91_01385 [Nanoarchaeota archaeon]|nr:hypothetical protein [Nanoarchaeota archaeon]MBU1029866.1 hypothetical protein [Nanoarchaeota archaeon]MBU1849284.1 hypothetical protein [Nanoarchaeota archaeon]
MINRKGVGPGILLALILAGVIIVVLVIIGPQNIAKFVSNIVNIAETNGVSQSQQEKIILQNLNDYCDKGKLKEAEQELKALEEENSNSLLIIDGYIKIINAYNKKNNDDKVITFSNDVLNGYSNMLSEDQETEIVKLLVETYYEKGKCNEIIALLNGKDLKNYEFETGFKLLQCYIYNNCGQARSTKGKLTQIFSDKTEIIELEFKNSGCLDSY